jgi:osmotically-inducible protein OsmY
MGEAFPDGRVSIQTTSYNRMVLLVGEVPNEVDKTTAEQVVARIDTVVSVVNELRVGQPSTFNETSNDVLITTKVKASLVDAKDLLANSIKVVTHRNVVYLMGRVTEREILTEAELANSGAKSPVKPASAASAP